MNDNIRNMKDFEFERLVRSRIEHHEADVPEELWAQIQKDIPRHTVSKAIWQYAAALAAVLAGAIVIFTIFFDSPDNAPESLQSRSILPGTENAIYADSPEEPVNTATINEKTAIEPTPDIIKIIHHEHNIKIDSTDITKTDARPEKKENRDGNREPEERQTQKKNIYTHPNPVYPAGIFNKRKNKPDDLISIGLLASNLQTNSSGSMGKQYFMRDYKQMSLFAAAAAEPQEKKYTHHMPLTFGLTIGKTFSNRIGFESGVTYSLLRSSYTAGEYKGKQQLHYIGIPLYLTYRFAEWKRISFYVAAGGKIDFCVSGKTDEMDGEQTLSSNMNLSAGNTRSIKDDPQFALLAKAGVSYPIVSKLELYAEPTLGYYFDNKSNVQNYWKDKPLGFSLQIGLRANF